MFLLIIFLCVAAAAQGLQVYKMRGGNKEWHEKRAAHFAGAHGLMLFGMAVNTVFAGITPFMAIVAILTALPPLYWVGRDIFEG